MVVLRSSGCPWQSNEAEPSSGNFAFCGRSSARPIGLEDEGSSPARPDRDGLSGDVATFGCLVLRANR